VSYAEGIKQKTNTTTLKYGMKHLVSACVRIRNICYSSAIGNTAKVIEEKLVSFLEKSSISPSEFCT